MNRRNELSQRAGEAIDGHLRAQSKKPRNSNDYLGYMVEQNGKLRVALKKWVTGYVPSTRMAKVTLPNKVLTEAECWDFLTAEPARQLEIYGQPRSTPSPCHVFGGIVSQKGLASSFRDFKKGLPAKGDTSTSSTDEPPSRTTATKRPATSDLTPAPRKVLRPNAQPTLPAIRVPSLQVQPAAPAPRPAVNRRVPRSSAETSVGSKSAGSSSSSPASSSGSTGTQSNGRKDGYSPDRDFDDFNPADDIQAIDSDNDLTGDDTQGDLGLDDDLQDIEDPGAGGSNGGDSIGDHSGEVDDLSGGDVNDLTGVDVDNLGSGDVDDLDNLLDDVEGDTEYLRPSEDEISMIAMIDKVCQRFPGVPLTMDLILKFPQSRAATDLMKSLFLDHRSVKQDIQKLTRVILTRTPKSSALSSSPPAETSPSDLPYKPQKASALLNLKKPLIERYQMQFDRYQVHPKEALLQLEADAATNGSAYEDVVHAFAHANIVANNIPASVANLLAMISPAEGWQYFVKGSTAKLTHSHVRDASGTTVKRDSMDVILPNLSKLLLGAFRNLTEEHFGMQKSAKTVETNLGSAISKYLNKCYGKLNKSEVERTSSLKAARKAAIAAAMNGESFTASSGSGTKSADDDETSPAADGGGTQFGQEY